MTLKRLKVTIGMAILLFLFAFPISAFSDQNIQKNFDKIDEKLYKLLNVANDYPPKIEKKKDLEKFLKLWHEVENELAEQLSKDKDNYDVIVRLGECYRLGHNLDIKDSMEKADKYLKKAISLNPEFMFPHLLLGYHYTFSLRPYDGEQELLSVLKFNQEKEKNILAMTYWGLAHASYFQKKFKEASSFSSKYLEFYPDNHIIKCPGLEKR